MIDTCELNVHDLRRRVIDLFADGSRRDTTQVTVMSFGYKYGVPPDADLVLDCRFLPNPHWVDDLRPITGLDDRCRTTWRPSTYRRFIDRLNPLLDFLLPAYVDEGKSVLTVAFGCTGGHHRSVTMAEHSAAWLRGKGVEPRLGTGTCEVSAGAGRCAGRPVGRRPRRRPWPRRHAPGRETYTSSSRRWCRWPTTGGPAGSGPRSTIRPRRPPQVPGGAGRTTRR